MRHQHIYWLLILTIWLPLAAACAGPSESASPTLPATAEPSAAAAPSAAEPGEPADLGEITLITPTPMPTATPSVVQEAITVVTTATGLNEIQFLGLTTEDWLNLAISLLVLALGLLVIIPLLYYLLRRLAGVARAPWVGAALDALEQQVKWLLGVWITQYATNRLTVLPVEVKQWLDQLYSSVYVVILAVVVWKVINRALALYQKRAAEESDQGHQQAFLTFVRRVSLVLLVIIAAAAVLNNYGYNVTLALVILALGGLAISIASRDTLVDLLNGFVILFDRPFSIGDRIGLQDLDTWGDVVEIGTRTTRIRTLDNRLVIVPNSKIGRNLVVNYSYPDTHYRIETRVNIPYGADVEHVRRTIVASVQDVAGILIDQPIDALFDEFGPSALIFRVRWWIDSYTDTRYMLDRVHSALYQALGEAGVRIPYPIYEINLKQDQQ